MEFPLSEKHDNEVVVVVFERTIDQSRRVYLGQYNFMDPIYFLSVGAEDHSVIGRIPWLIRLALGLLG